MNNQAILAALTWAARHPDKVGAGEYRELSKVFTTGETEAVTNDRLAELDFANIAGLTEKVAIMQSLDQAASDITILPCCEWAGWVIYLLERLNTICAGQLEIGEANPKDFFGIAVLEPVEDAIMQRLNDGVW